MTEIIFFPLVSTRLKVWPPGDGVSWPDWPHAGGSARATDVCQLAGGAQFGQALAHLFEMVALVSGQNVEQGAH